jgi:N-succinyldiaminopimelate aminotransferase
MPNPFYQIYEGAALLAGARPYFLNTGADNGYRMDFARVPDEIWQQGAAGVHLLARQPDRRGAAARRLARLRAGRAARLPDRLGRVLLGIVFRRGPSAARDCCRWRTISASPTTAAAWCSIQLSKRSNLPGLRSGFVAGDGAVLEQYFQYRTYQGCALPPPTQAASIAAWNDEAHVRANRDQYRAKFDAVLEILAPVLDVDKPEAGFYLWPETPTGRRNLHARAVCARERAGAARQLPVARCSGRESGPQPRAPGAGGAAGRVRRGRPTHPKLCRIAVT